MTVAVNLRFDTGADLAGAEDLAGVLARALREILNPETGFDAQAAAIDALAEFSGYCRPTCGFLDDGHCHTADPAGCACICGHDDDDDPLDRTPPEHRHHPRLPR